MIDLCIKFVPTPSTYVHQLILAMISVIIVGIGGGIYLVSNLGAGPRDGLMIGLQKISNLPIALVRAALEISAVSVGWYLGGTVGIGGGIYLVANLGAGPRDGLMVGLQKLTNFPIAAVRATLEISVVSVGWYFGGTVGIGTILFGFGIGPCVALGLYLDDKTID